MTPLIDFAILSFASLFVIVDPIGLIPTFLAMTPRNTAKERVQIAAQAAVITFLILFVCALGGQGIFKIFGITLSAFEIAGGVVLLLIALDMLRARRTAVKETQEEQDEGTEKENIAVTPLAIPMLAGPGAITTVILLASKASSMNQFLVLNLNILLIAVITFVILYGVAVRSSAIGIIPMKIVSRLMGLLLSSIAIQFILNGIAHSRIFGPVTPL